ncbi:MAG TPA: 2-dehydropantoate 2-reductase [Gaiellaceae bacterium]|nr:2-dehydropantoate 2-reductase [Gaiellaceae bacterium]
MTVAVLGPGAVGGTLAVRLAAAGRDVVCVARAETAAAIRQRGLALAAPDGEHHVRVDTTDRLDVRVDVLVVSVKAPGLDDALGRIESEPATTVPLLNGLEHVERLRERLGRVVVGSASSFQAFRETPTLVRQLTPGLVVTLAGNGGLREALEVPGVTVRAGGGERQVLWDKAARLGPLAAATTLTGDTVGELRTDPEWGPRLREAIAEACAVAAADGAAVDVAGQWAIIETMSPSLTTSAARDAAAGRPTELDALAGAIVRAGARLGVPTPTLAGLLAGVEETCPAP